MEINIVFCTILFLYSFNLAQSEYLKDPHDWDVLIFTQQWPSTVCDEWKKHNPSHACNLPSNTDSWTIHGIWPTKFGTLGPGFCNNSWHFDPELIRPIETQLTQLWTNIEEGTSTYSLWTHEWSKHGTCAASIEPLNSELKYFKQGLSWVQKYKLYDILDKVSIVPSNDKTYNIVDIHKAIENELGVNPCIECRKENGKSYLVELRICFNKFLGLVDCDGVVHSKTIDGTNILTNCAASEGIIYPATPQSLVVPNKMYVQLYKLIQWLQWFTL